MALSMNVLSETYSTHVASGREQTEAWCGRMDRGDGCIEMGGRHIDAHGSLRREFKKNGIAERDDLRQGKERCSSSGEMFPLQLPPHTQKHSQLPVCVT